MSKVAIMTDSNSGILFDEAQNSDIYMVPMPFIIDGKEYQEGVDLSHEQFYQMLGDNADVSTSQPSPSTVCDMWDEIFEEGYDEIIYIPMSSGLSQSCHTAMGFATEYDGKVQVVDNKRISVTQRQSVFDACNLAKQGKGANEIREILEKDSLEASIYITVDTLTYLKKGGRVTAAAAAIGSVLNIKPVLQIQGEKLDALAKVRGMKAARQAMINAMKKDISGRLSPLDKKGKLQLAIAYSYIDDETLNSWVDEVKASFPNCDIVINALALSIGCHIGPGALAIAACIIE